MDLAYPSVLKRRHRIQETASRGERVGLPGGVPDDGLPDPEVEADDWPRTCAIPQTVISDPADTVRASYSSAATSSSLDSFLLTHQ